jgi:hypothetical protein
VTSWKSRVDPIALEAVGAEVPLDRAEATAAAVDNCTVRRLRGLLAAEKNQWTANYQETAVD